MTFLCAEGVSSFITEELHEQSSAFSSKLIEALIHRLNKRRQKTLIGLVKYIKNGKMHSTESRSSGHSDSNLEALPAKSAVLSAAKLLLIRLYDKMFALPNSEEGVSHSQSVDPDQRRSVSLSVSRPRSKKECLTLSQSTQIKEGVSHSQSVDPDQRRSVSLSVSRPRSKKECLTLSQSTQIKEGVSHSQSVDPDQRRSVSLSVSQPRSKSNSNAVREIRGSYKKRNRVHP